MLKEFSKAAKAHNILIILASSRLSEFADPGSSEEGSWYNSEVSENDVIKSWERLAQAFCDQWNVVGIDLQNEVRPYCLPPFPDRICCILGVLLSGHFAWCSLIRVPGGEGLPLIGILRQNVLRSTR